MSITKDGSNSPSTNMFKEHQNACTTSDYTTCPALIRLFISLKYHTNLDVINDRNDQNVFVDFMDNVYPYYLNDIIHFVKEHGHQLQQIYFDLINIHGFSKCDLKKCMFASRHYGYQNYQQQNNDIDLVTEYHVNNMDSLHFHIYHSYDAGLRVSSTQLQNEYNILSKSAQNEEQKDDEYFDIEFKRLRTAISRTARKTELFRRFKRGKNPKQPGWFSPASNQSAAKKQTQILS